MSRRNQKPPSPNPWMIIGWIVLGLILAPFVISALLIIFATAVH